MLDPRDPALVLRRRLPVQAATALDIIALMESQALPWHEFELRMHERGCNSRGCLVALASLERRNWATKNGSTLVVSDAGYAAALQGVKIVPPKKVLPRRQRRPNWLFG